MKWTILIILIAYFVAMFIIGLIANRKSKTVTDYYVAGRGLGGVITALVYMSSLVSAGALVGWTGQASSYGVWFIFAGCAVTIATYICWRLLSGKVMRLSKKLDLLTVPDFLEARFESRTARLIAGLILLIFTVPLMVSQFKAAGLLLNMVTGIDYKAAVVLFGVIVFVYVAFGGYFAVVYTDAVQGGLMLFGIAALVITALIAVGGNLGEAYAAANPIGAVSWPTTGSALTSTAFIAVILSNRDTSQQNTFKTGINALKSDDIISSCGQRISCFYLCSQVYCAQTGTSALWDVTYEPDVGAMNRFLLISQQVVTFSSTRNVRNLNMRGAYTMYIVGIDIAKRKHEAAVIDGEGAVIIKPFSFTNNCSGYNRLLAMLAKAKLPLDEVSFAMEATGHYWLALFTRLQKEGFRVQVINPVQTNSIRSFYIRQAKTDPRDALLIAEVIRFGHFSESTLHPENIYELRELCRGRHAIVSMQADVKRKVVALLDQVFPEYETAFTNMFGDTSMAILQTCPTPKELSEMPFEELCHLIEVSSHKRFRMAKAQELQELARNSFGFAMAGDVFSTMIRLYAKHLDFLKQQVREMDRKIAEIMETLDTPITTITGIGPTLGAYILSEIGDISRFSSAAKLAAYAGIDPTMRQSGEYNGVRNRMSKRGSPYLRHAIWLAASSAVLHDPALKLYFQKKRDEGKPYMASVGHACRKMVSIIYAVMRDNKAYTPYIPNEISA